MKKVLLVLGLAAAGYFGYNFYLSRLPQPLAAHPPVSKATAAPSPAVAVTAQPKVEPAKVELPENKPAVLPAPMPLPSDWTLTDGTIYHHVKVIKVEDDSVTVLHQDGGARIALGRLPQNLRDSLGYDPAKARIAADTRAQEEARNAAALQAESDRAAQLKKQQLIFGARQQQAAITAINIVNRPAEVTQSGNTITVKKIVKVEYDPSNPPTPAQLEATKPVWTNVTDK